MNCGINNPRYIDGRRMYKDSIDTSRCEMCGKKVEAGNKRSIEVHHGDANRANNSPDNLTALCSACHRIRKAAKTGNIIVDLSRAPFPMEVKLHGDDTDK